MKNSTKLYLLNIPLFIVLFILFFLTAFGLGYGSNNSYQAATWRLFGEFVVAHLIINFLLIRRFKISQKSTIIYNYIEIVTLYGFVTWVYW